MPDQTIGVLVGAAFSGVVRGAEIEFHAPSLLGLRVAMKPVPLSAVIVFNISGARPISLLIRRLVLAIGRGIKRGIPGGLVKKANKSLQPTFDPPPIFAIAKTGVASNAAELKR
ncbi:hypothetical protein [Microbulbifer taiwanensis]|uniref:hypothetical protein n=1 Tax=Microbulbifer taiwanensis TaxID=986746 RepID=UPI003611DA4C